MRTTPLFRRLAVVMCLALAGAGVLEAQNYQSHFSEVAFDRANGPSTLHGGVEVENATGAVSMALPLGPGIGARGLRFTPTLALRWAPQILTHGNMERCVAVDPSSDFSRVTTQWSYDLESQAGGGQLYPGVLDLRMMTYYGNRMVSKFSLYTGESGGITNGTPAGVTATSVLPVVQAFGYGPDATVVPLPIRTGYAGMEPPPPYDATPHLTTNGWIIVGLSNATHPVQTKNEPIGSASSAAFQYPGLVLAIQGDLAYEFEYYAMVPHQYWYVVGTGGQWVTNNPPLDDLQALSYGHAFDPRYRLRRVLNRFGESLAFTYVAGGAGLEGWTTSYPTQYTATWKRGVTGGSEGTAYGPSITVTGDVFAGQQVKVAYAGIGAVNPAYTVDVTTSKDQFVPPSYVFADDPTPGWEGILPTAVKDLNSGEAIQFSYSYPAPTAGTNNSVAPALLTKVHFPTRDVTLAWAQYAYVRNRAVQDYQGFIPDAFFAWSFGVTSISEQALRTDGTADGPSRLTTHARTLPVMNSVPNTMTYNATWATTDFYDVVTQPNGYATLYRYASPYTGPAPGARTSPNAPQPADFQTLAFLKHQLLEVRRYAGALDASDLATAAENSTAFERQRFGGNVASNGFATSAWSLNAVANPSGQVGIISQAYPTVEESWRTEGDTRHITSTLGGWDATGFGWTQPTTVVQLNGVDTTSLVDGAGFESDPANGYLGRLKSQQKTVQSDAFASLAPGTLMPAALPRTTQVRDSLGRLQSVTSASADGSLQITTTQVFPAGTSGDPALAQVQSVALSGSIADAATAGVQQYLYDGNGFLRAIQPKGVNWTFQQQNDAVGRPIAQTDPNGFTTTFTYDASGRLTDITPPAGELPTHIDYKAFGATAPDFRHVTVTRGAQVREYAYNGFGELIREGRTDGSTWSYKLYGYDTMGRRTGETVWLPATSADENQWSSPNLLISTTVTWPPRTICKGWATDDTGTAYCKAWGTTPGGSSTTPAYANGTLTAYDGEGREVKVVDANGTTATTSYTLLSATRTVGAGAETAATTFTRDVLGRLVQVTDPLAQTTQYQYDAAGRIARVVQMGAGGVQQIRTWAYDGLGRLTALVQPESGTTTYASFTASGKPMQMVYGAGSATPLTVTSTPGPVDRLLALSSADGSVNQTFSYDDTTHGKALGKLSSATANSVTRSLVYSGLNGRLSSLTRTVDGLNFTQGLSYDAYGNLSSRSYPDGKSETLVYNPAQGLPTSASFNGAAVVNAFGYDTASWAPIQISYANGAASSFGYRPDQVTLKTMSHAIPGQAGLSWAFQYDSRGNLTTDGEDWYNYDPLDRLLSAFVRDPFNSNASQGILQQFSYDAFGNRLSLNSQAVTNWAAGSAPPTALATAPTTKAQTYGFNTSDAALWGRNQLPATTTAGAQTGALYDAQGNLTQIWGTPGSSATQLTLTYDALGRVTTMGDTAHGTSQAYGFDDEGLRIKITDSKTGQISYNIYDENRQLIAEYQGGVWKDIVSVGGKELAEIGGNGIPSITFSDHLGSPRYLWDGIAAHPAVQQKFLPFGEMLEDPATAAKFSKGFTNHEQTDPSGLIYMQARFYAPMYGRFLSPDPARDQHFEQTQSWNIYSYVQNDPTMNIDPNGEQLVAIRVLNAKSVSVDSKTRGHVLVVDQSMVPRVTALIRQAEKDGTRLTITSSFRTNEEQAGLNSGNSTTPAKAGTSPHNAGLAIDGTDGKSKTLPDPVVDQAEDLGLRWGGNFKKPDDIHVDGVENNKQKSDLIQSNQQQWKSGTVPGMELDAATGGLSPANIPNSEMRRNSGNTGASQSAPAPTAAKPTIRERIVNWLGRIATSI